MATPSCATQWRRRAGDLAEEAGEWAGEVAPEVDGRIEEARGQEKELGCTGGLGAIGRRRRGSGRADGLVKKGGGQVEGDIGYIWGRWAGGRWR